MTPLSFEWKWAADYFVFMGLLYLALGIIGCGAVIAYLKTWLEVKHGEESAEKISGRSKYSRY